MKKVLITTMILGVCIMACGCGNKKKNSLDDVNVMGGLTTSTTVNDNSENDPVIQGGDNGSANNPVIQGGDNGLANNTAIQGGGQESGYIVDDSSYVYTPVSNATNPASGNSADGAVYGEVTGGQKFETYADINDDYNDEASQQSAINEVNSIINSDNNDLETTTTGPASISR